tara:strand:- start:25070 stop:25534 length:465 start_codon:yes stop_codon:yes gene_type:complete
MALNQYTQLLYYIKSLGDSDVFINTVTQGDVDDIDLQKMNLYPLLHIEVNGAGFTNGSTIIFNVQIAALDVRDINKEVITDKFWKQDNEVDNLNETLAVLNRLWSIMYRDFDDNNITASENPTLEKILESGTNLLDGWLLSFDVEMPNDTISLC